MADPRTMEGIQQGHKLLDLSQTIQVCRWKSLQYRGPAHNGCKLNYCFHAFLFNIKNYSSEVRNIQRCKVELNINLLRVNNFDITEKNGIESSNLSYMCCELDLDITGFFICWFQWFDADWPVGGIVVLPQLFLGQPFHRDFIGQVLCTEGCCG